MTRELLHSMDQKRRKCQECGGIYALKRTYWQKAGPRREDMRRVPRSWLWKHVCRGEIPKRFRRDKR